jgi:hypothetical protein
MYFLIYLLEVDSITKYIQHISAELSRTCTFTISHFHDLSLSRSHTFTKTLHLVNHNSKNQSIYRLFLPSASSTLIRLCSPSITPLHSNSLLYRSSRIQELPASVFVVVIILNVVSRLVGCGGTYFVTACNHQQSK